MEKGRVFLLGMEAPALNREAFGIQMVLELRGMVIPWAGSGHWCFFVETKSLSNYKVWLLGGGRASAVRFVRLLKNNIRREIL